MVDTLIKDIIINSFEKPYLEFSDKIFEALMTLQEWNYKNIYARANTKEELIKRGFSLIPASDCSIKKVDSYKDEYVYEEIKYIKECCKGE